MEKLKQSHKVLCQPILYYSKTKLTQHCNRTHHSHGIPKTSLRNNCSNYSIICMAGRLQTKILHLNREGTFNMLEDSNLMLLYITIIF
jgi:hypothetical protein